VDVEVDSIALVGDDIRGWQVIVERGDVRCIISRGMKGLKGRIPRTKAMTMCIIDVVSFCSRDEDRLALR